MNVELAGVLDLSSDSDQHEADAPQPPPGRHFGAEDFPVLLGDDEADERLGRVGTEVDGFEVDAQVGWVQFRGRGAVIAVEVQEGLGRRRQ